MAEEKSMNCTSCNLHIQASNNFVKFRCPQCDDELIIRCINCKTNGTMYVCGKCGFEGP